MCVCVHKHSCLNGKTNSHGFLMSDSFFMLDIYIIYIHPHITKTLEKRISCPSHGKNFQIFNENLRFCCIQQWPSSHSTDYHFLCVFGEYIQKFICIQGKNMCTTFSQIEFHNVKMESCYRFVIKLLLLTL